VAFGWSPGKSLAISPDGSRVVYVATKSDVPGDTDSQNVLVLREFASGDSTDLPGTAGARQPFFSADGRWVGFFTNAALKKVSLGGGNPVTLAEPISNGRWAFGAWTHDDQIIFSTGESGLHLVPAAGGTPSVVVAPDATSGERYLRPTAIPGTDAVLFDVMHLNQGRSRIEAIRLSSGERKVVVENGSSSRHLSTGHLVFQQDDGILLASIDARTLSLSAAAVPVPYNVRRDMAARFTTLQMDVSRTGTMIYAPAVDGSRTLGVVDGTGAFQALGVPAGDIDMASASPDGQLVAFAPLGQVYVYDRTRGSILKLTQSGRDTGPAWHPNGRAVVVSSGTPSGQVLVLKGVDGSQRTLYSVEGIALLRHPSWSPDGTHLAFTIQKDAQQDIWVTTTGDTPKAEPLIDGLAAEYFPRFSPDGRWLAYVSDESGRLETYVRRFPTGERVLASVEGGGPPAWSRDGRTLYFQHLAGDKPEIAAVPMISTSTGLRPGTPRRVLEMQTPGATGELAEYLRSSTNGQRWDVLPDGRFLVIRGAATQTGSREIAVVQNWFEDVKGLAPSK
jgi:serine/threonine-protein kinase